MRKGLVVALASAFLLSGCYSFRGPEPVLDSRGVVMDDSFGPRIGPLFERFREQAERAAAACLPSDADCTGEVREPIMEDFMRSGYALIYADCSRYFAHMGRNQGRSRLGRDIIAPVGAMITGIISIVRFENSRTRDDLLASLALATTAGTSTLDVYQQNFLFGSDNIDAVRQLITRALATHASDTLSASNTTFEQAVLDLLDNQAICTPSHILTLTRQAIASGNPEPTDGAGDDDKDDKEDEDGDGELRSTGVSVPADPDE